AGRARGGGREGEACGRAFGNGSGWWRYAWTFDGADVSEVLFTFASVLCTLRPSALRGGSSPRGDDRPRGDALMYRTIVRTVAAMSLVACAGSNPARGSSEPRLE